MQHGTLRACIAGVYFEQCERRLLHPILALAEQQ